MDMISEPQKVVPPGPIQPRPQPIAAFEGLDPILDDSAVRAAIVKAEAEGADPMNLPMESLLQGQVPPVAPIAQAPAPVEAPVVIPEKFLKPDGTVDVEKIQASTRQLDEGIQKKEAALAQAKSIEDYMKDYREREKTFRNLPNLDRLAKDNPPPPMAPITNAPVHPSQMTDQQLEALIRADYDANPIATTTRLIDIAVSRALEPVRAKEQDDVIRKNVESLATQDGRVLDPQVFAALTQKLKERPDLWSTQNPHRAAWLEVKEELRLGEAQKASAQPSRPLSPVLGGGTPPSIPSSQQSVTPHTIVSNLDKLDLKDRRQEEMGDEAIRAILAGRR